MKSCSYCKKSFNYGGLNCRTCISKIRRYKAKLKSVEYLGGKRVKCGYNKHIAALEFHHIDPSNKDYLIGDLKNRKWEKIVKELDKCVLLCSNCHRIEHSDYNYASNIVREAKRSAKSLE